MSLKAEVVKVGTWLYDENVEMSVRIIRQNWDYYYEEGYDDEPPRLNSEGHAYYVDYGAPIPPKPGNPYQQVGYPSRSRTCLSLEEALELAHQGVPSEITWGRLPKGEDPE